MKAGSNQQEDCPSTVNETLLSVRTPGDVPQVRMLILGSTYSVLRSVPYQVEKVVSILEEVCCFLLQV